MELEVCEIFYCLEGEISIVNYFVDGRFTISCDYLYKIVAVIFFHTILGCCIRKNNLQLICCIKNMFGSNLIFKSLKFEEISLIPNNH